MKTAIKIYIQLLWLLCAFTAKSFAQLASYNNNKEKVYIHTNHVFFKPGEDLFFKVYLVNALNQYPSVISNVVYVEIINPSGNVLQKLNYRIEDGYTEGHYQFNADAPGGLYRIRAYTTWMRNEKEDTWFTKEVTLQKVIAPRILMKLDFPRKGYGPGEKVTADYSIRDLANKPISNYEVKYTLSLGGTVIQTNKFQTDTAGKATINFHLPANLNTNDGILNVTINYDSYVESISRSIPIVLNKIDLQFMPEGGTLVEGIATNVAFKAINENGKPADIKGQIIDAKGNIVCAFESYHFGMGQFRFTPQPGNRYVAKITTPTGISQPFDLPTATKQGVVMNISPLDSLLQFRIVTNKEMNVKLVGQSRNNLYYKQDIQLKKGEQFIKMNPVDFPAGIARFTITDNNNIPLTERIIFLHPHKVLQVKITADKDKYLPREKVTLRIKTVDENGIPIPSNLSLSVVDDKLWSLADDKQDHILSWLLMSTELHGKVEEPPFYFKREEKKALPALDLVMLTHGYRYFDYIDYIEKTGKPKYSPDLNNILSGVILNKKGEPVKSTVYLISSDTKKHYNDGTITQQATSEDGIFFFTDITPALNYHLVARSDHTREQVTIKILQQGTGYNPLPVRKTNDPFDDGRLPPPLMAVNDKPKEKEKEKENLQNFWEKPFGGGKNLNDVVVIGYGIVRDKRSLGYAITEQKYINSFSNALQGKVAGVQITTPANPGDASKIVLRGTHTLSGNDQPLIILDGHPIDKIDANLNPALIESVTVFKDAAATAIYGSRAANGVIVITSRSFNNKQTMINLDPTYYYASKAVQTQSTEYNVARRFYAPKYYSLETKERDDFRENIYWNPVVQTDKNGDATLEFYNSDATTTFRAIAEGIGYNGKPGRTEMAYAVQSVMSIDARIPPYLTVGDNALIPLVIKNNGRRPLHASIMTKAPANIETGHFQDTVTIAPDSSRQILIPIKALSAINENIKFTINSLSGTETLSLPITAGNKGFPVITTISGNKSADVSFAISKMVPGSLKSALTIFSDTEGQLLNGIESMLSEPYGCFEQTSSTTYPNIYILKYLRATGKTNKAIEDKARGYISKGYSRLIGFETAKNGFEWFGKTPPHEALTAYGLLEFTDMQEFIDVDKKMLARTKAFLLSRRNGKGTFDLTSGKYGFASVPEKIANIYIVYALTQAGIGNEIQLEYQTAVTAALKSNDAYQLAMMALAASNMKQEQDFKQLMNALNDSKLTSETSVVNSRNVSLRVETMALYALALSRESSPRIGVIADVISRILAEKCHYGYGATQATVLALNAIVTYQQLRGEIAAGTKMEFKLNNKTVVTGGDMQTDFKEGQNTFSVHYENDKAAIPYNMEVAYFTLLPPDSPEAALKLDTRLNTAKTQTGETVRMEIAVKNIEHQLQPMAIAKIGIPAGLSVQPWQLKEIMEKNQIAYYEIFDNYLVLYWMGFAQDETKKIYLDLKAEIPGTYKGKASNTYLYYTPEYKHWNEGMEIDILP
jgi:TonB-dependent SusC/RagA subfamily outer membrane receptor